MPLLSEKTKNRLLAPLAISPIMEKGALPGLIGFLLFGLGFWLKAGWLKVVGMVFMLPILWVYAVIIVIFFPMLIFDSISNRIKRIK